MAQRRMFSKVITNSARFLKMPVDSQSLYFHLGMAADDDGIVEAWSVLRSTGSAEDNLRVLASKGLVKVLNEDLVSYILDWNEHNAMRSDRLTPSSYRELLVQVLPEVELVVPTQRADRIKRLGRPVVVPGAPQDRIGEGRVSKDTNTSSVAIAPLEVYEVSIERDEKPVKSFTAKYPNTKKVFSLWGNYPKIWEKNTSICTSGEWLYEEKGMEELQELFAWYAQHKTEQYCPKFHDPISLVEKYPKLEDHLARTS